MNVCMYSYELRRVRLKIPPPAGERVIVSSKPSQMNRSA